MYTFSPSIYSLISLVPYDLSAKILLPCMLSFDNISTAFLLSWTWPAVKPIYRGLPSPSTTACIFVVLPPELFPICCPTSEPFAPFLLLHCSMSLHCRRINAEILIIKVFLQIFKYPKKCYLITLFAETGINCLPWSKTLRKIPPGCSTTYNPENCIKYQA